MKSLDTYVVQNRATEHFKVDETVYSPTLKQPRHWHPLAAIGFVLSGRCLETFGGKTYTREPLDVIFHPAYDSHAVEYGSNVRILRIHFLADSSHCFRDQLAIFDSSMDLSARAAATFTTRLRHELRQTDTASVLALEGLALEILAELARTRIGRIEKNCPTWLKEVKAFLNDTYSESIVLDDVARLAGVHPGHLCRVFRKKMGCTLGEYVRRLRLEFACQQMLKTDLSLGKIASQAGFSDQSHFNRAFRARFKISPNQYRQSVSRK